MRFEMATSLKMETKIERAAGGEGESVRKCVECPVTRYCCSRSLALQMIQLTRSPAHSALLSLSLHALYAPLALAASGRHLLFIIIISLDCNPNAREL